MVQTSLFTFPDFQALVDGLSAEHLNTVYSRGRNPTVQAVENKMALLERGESALCFASGMGAISAVMHATLRAGDHVLFVNQTYGPTLQLAAYLKRFGIEHDVCLDLEPARVEEALRERTRLLWMESPGTMTFRTADIGAMARLASARGITTCLDNSWATPLLQKPLDLGVDIVVHTATKYMGGHSDVVAGAVVSDGDRIERIFHDTYLLNGAALAPWSAWLLLRGMRTLPVRLERHEEAGLEVANFLASHPSVERVHHPRFTGPDDLVDRQLAGFTGTFSFELGRDDFETVSRVVDGLRLFHIGVSWGGTESLVISPCRPARPSGIIRLSVGLEGAEALIADLDQALRGL